MHKVHCCPAVLDLPAAVSGLGWAHPMTSGPMAATMRANCPRLAPLIFSVPFACQCRPASGAGAGEGELDAAVLGPPLWRVIRGDRVCIPAALCRDEVRIDPLGDEEIGDGLRPSQRQLLVVFDPLLAQLGADRNVIRVARHND